MFYCKWLMNWVDIAQKMHIKIRFLSIYTVLVLVNSFWAFSMFFVNSFKSFCFSLALAVSEFDSLKSLKLSFNSACSAKFYDLVIPLIHQVTHSLTEVLNERTFRLQYPHFRPLICVPIKFSRGHVYYL